MKTAADPPLLHTFLCFYKKKNTKIRDSRHLKLNACYVLQYFTWFWWRDFVVRYCQTVDASHYVPIKLFAVCTLICQQGALATWQSGRLYFVSFNLRFLRHGSDVYVTFTLSHKNPVTFQLLNPTLFTVYNIYIQPSLILVLVRS